MNSCQNGATCQVTSSNTYICLCAAGYMGNYCQQKNQCDSKPCQNNGTCAMPYTNMYQCTCPTGYTGTNCETTVAACASNPCLNGICLPGTVVNTFTCLCFTGFTGAYCQNSLNNCQNQVCVSNYTNQMLSLYTQPAFVSFSMYTPCIVNTWIAVNPSSKSSIKAILKCENI